MPNTNYKTTTEYISHFPTETQAILKEIRKTIKKAEPNLIEGISYGIPTFYLNGKYLVYFAAFKNHISIYPAITDAVKKAGLSEYKVSKGTLRFPIDKPIPYDLIYKFVVLRKEEGSS